LHIPTFSFTTSEIDLTVFDIILVNTSGGKDSQTCMRKVVHMAFAQGVLDRVVAVHADLPDVEWEGVPELAALQSAHYGLRFERTTRHQNTLLDHVVELHDERKAKGEDKVPWPDKKNRWCTSDHKRGPIRRVMTALVHERQRAGKLDNAENVTFNGRRRKHRPARLLNCMGLRAQESADRAAKAPFAYDERASGKGTVKQVWNWLPIHDWTEDEVWADIRSSGVPHHFAYDLGMPRLSCCFCIFSGRDALILAAQHNKALARRYAAVEAYTGYTMKKGLPFTEIIAAAETETIVSVRNWAA
jgi:3'-phosphoadenosine 5'-phosphosulfate sulfotransferase (PAPS reductase)/FAD synthetase